MGDFDELLGKPIPERVPSSPDDTSSGEVEPLPRDTRSQRRAIKAYAIDNMKKEGCTCRKPYPKIVFLDGDTGDDMEGVPEGAVRFNSTHQQTCTWILRHNAGTN